MPVASGGRVDEAELGPGSDVVVVAEPGCSMPLGARSTPERPWDWALRGFL